uniref:PCI domain-containing protein n=1 Tax=Panagrellus redivivus TaxID=6233 RepID=A0A7E4ZU44_PANRE
MSASIDTPTRRATLSSLAADSSVLPYSVLRENLKFATEDELESFLIAAVYDGYIKGEIDPQNQQFYVHDFAVGKVDPAQLPEVANTLAQWIERAEQLITKMEANIDDSDRKLFERMNCERAVEEAIITNRDAARTAEVSDPPKVSASVDGPKEPKRLRSRVLRR